MAEGDTPVGSSRDRESDVSPEEAKAFLESQKSEHRSILKMLRFVRRTDELDSSIALAIESLLSSEPTIETDLYTMNDIADIIHSFPCVDQVLSPQFFHRISLPFRLLRRSLTLHFVNPINEEKIRLLLDPLNEQGTSRLDEQIWFLLFIGAPASDIASNLITFNKMKKDANALSFQPIKQEKFKEGQEVEQNRNISYVAPQDVRRKFETPRQFGQNACRLQEVDSQVESNSPVRYNSTYRPEMAESIPRYNEPRTSPDNPHRAPLHHVRNEPNPDAAYSQSKKGQAVESYFRDRRFTGAPEQSVDNLIRDFEICAAQQCLNPLQMSLFFVNALADPARQFFLAQCSPRMPFDQIATHGQHRLIYVHAKASIGGLWEGTYKACGLY